MTEAFRKDTMRTMRKTMNRFCSILLIVALGVGFFAGVRATGDDMRDTASDYYIDYNAMDVKVLSTLGFSENDVAAVAAVDGVKQVYAGKYVDCLTLCHDNFLTRVFSLPQNQDSPETMNRLRVLEGQLPQAADECVIDEKIQYKYHFDWDRRFLWAAPTQQVTWKMSWSTPNIPSWGSSIPRCTWI